MQRLRGLYENSAVPVREIAALAGVTERTLYKYVEKGGWRRRYAMASRAKDFAPVKGSGGRFIKREEKGKPFASGILALDPAGAERAMVRCERAQKLSAKAQRQAQAAARCRAALAQAEKERRTQARILDCRLDILFELVRVAVALREKPAAPRIAAAAERVLHAMLDRLEGLRAMPLH
jgi:hypothetical protein